MLDTNHIITSIDQNAAPESWRVWRAHTRYFIYLILLGVIFGAFGVYGALNLMGHPDAVYVLCPGNICPSDPLDASSFMNWRLGDFAFLASCVVIGAFTFIKGVSQVGSARRQVLVLTPEGLVVNAGRVSGSINFSTAHKLSATLLRANLIVSYFGPNGKRAHISLDGRFGRRRPIARAILQAWHIAHTPPRQ